VCPILDSSYCYSSTRVNSAGYVATGFWAGIALGRLALPRLNLLIGEWPVVFIYVGIAIGLEVRRPNLLGCSGV